jgi:hypothetical protein
MSNIKAMMEFSSDRNSALNLCDESFPPNGRKDKNLAFLVLKLLRGKVYNQEL